MTRKFACAFVSLLALSGLIAGSANAAGKRLTIALVPGITTDAFYITMRRGAQAAADALGDTLVYQGPSDSDVVSQVSVLGAVIARHPDAILITPADKIQLVQPLKRAAEVGIRVITLDTFIGTGSYQTGSGVADFPLSYIASDNIIGGQIAARALAQSIGNKGKVYVSNVRPGVSTTDQREQGFRSEMRNHPDVVVLETQFNDNDANKAASQLQAMLARNPDLAGVFGANIFSALGSANGVKQAGASGKVKVVSFDAPKTMVDQLKTGLIDIAIAQHPAEIGYFGVVSAHASLNGQSVPTTIGTGFSVMTKDNVGDPAISQFLYSG